MNLAGELVVTNARFDQLADEMRLLFRSGGSIEAGSALAKSLLRAMSQHEDAEATENIEDSFAADRITGIIGNDGGSEEGAALRRGWMERGRRVSGQVSETVDQLARLSRNIQQAVLETRMIPIGPLFNRFRRTVRDIALKQGKPVRLELEGEMTELDKRMVDELGDPMVHLIRNALDHGIESADARAHSGKALEGLIKLRAYHQSNHVVIEISDDGAGIDAARVRARALERGLATESEFANDARPGSLRLHLARPDSARRRKSATFLGAASEWTSYGTALRRLGALWNSTANRVWAARYRFVFL